MADEKISLPSTNIDESLPSYYSDVFTPWETKEQLELGKEVKGTAGWFQVKCWQTTISTTWTLSITWVGFKPKFIRFQAVDWSNSWSNCDIDSFSWYHNWLRMWKSWWVMYFDQTNNAVQLYRDSGSLYVIVDFSSFDADWFTVNRLVVWFSAIMQWTCFG